MLTTEKIRDFFLRGVWQLEPATLSGPRRVLVQIARVTFVLAREVVQGDLTLRAMSLVYTTLLSLVPLLAVSFSVLKAFGVHNQIAPLLGQFLAPLGPKGMELTTRIIGFVENVRVGLLGAIGLLFLFYTVISLIQKTEESFNFVWRVRNPRPFSRRFSDYLSVILIGPVLVFSAIAVTASVMNFEVVRWLLQHETIGPMVLSLGRLLPYAIVIGAFSFMYVFIPNTRVRWRSALVGGTVAGVLWQTTGYVFASFAAGSMQNVIYSSFAIVLLFMVWLYLSWFILLFGSQVAYFHQHPQQIRLGRGRFVLSPRLTEQTGLTVMYLVTERYMHGGEPWATDALVARLKLPGDAVDDLLQVLMRGGLLVCAGPVDNPVFVPARDPDTIGVQEVLHVLRSAGEEEYAAEAFRLDVTAVNQLLTRAAESQPGLDSLSIKALVQSGTTDTSPVVAASPIP
ncbi:MAG: YihY/virulence factor BrkB family protein [Thiohalomonadaceae bacterium]